MAKSASKTIPAALVGNYSYRFQGQGNQTGVPFALAGLGRFNLYEDGKLDGSHTTSFTMLHGWDAQLVSNNYKLEGVCTIDEDETQLDFADIKFFPDPPPQKPPLDGPLVRHLRFLNSGKTDHYWLMSRYDVNASSLPELVTGEVVRTGPLKASAAPR